MPILGIDEVGRGPWAGPLVAGAVVLRAPVEGLADSKKLSKKRRETLDVIIHENAWVGLGWVAAAEIDELGMTKAVQLAMLRAVEALCIAGGTYTEIIIDGNINYFSAVRLDLSPNDRLPSEKRVYEHLVKGLTSHQVRAVIGADGVVAEVSAASIIAKVARDKYMAELAKQYPEYGFDKHVGYGTAAHAAALHQYGVMAEHRKSFAPIKKINVTSA